MKSLFLTAIGIVGLIFILAWSELWPTMSHQQSHSLLVHAGNSSCLPGQLCHTMDYLAKHSSEFFFSPDHINVTLIYMCGVHNYTKSFTVQNLHSFVMKGTAKSREIAIIDYQFTTQFGKLHCTIIQFFNVSFVNITNLTMKCPAINLNQSNIIVKSSSLYGYPGIEESLSFINITGRGSQAFLDNCTFRENCVITSNFSDGVSARNSTFQSYRHQFNSIIVALSSVVTLTGNVNFTDSTTGIDRPRYSSGTAVFLRTTHPEFKSMLNITTGATVYFVNLTSSEEGGAVFGKNGMIHIGAKAKVVFMHNVADIHGGAVSLTIGMITIGNESNVYFANNTAYSGGAIWLSDGTLNIDTDASLTFSHNNSAYGLGGGAIYLQNGDLIVNSNTKVNFRNNFAFTEGGALLLDNATIHVDTDTVQFSNNNANAWGGAMYIRYGTVYINSDKSMKFIMNTAQAKGGAIYIDSGVGTSIIVENSAKLLLFNNSAFQGGALYINPSSFAISVGYQSSVQFINNTASDIGGAVYAEMQPAAPCLFTITDYSAEISFIGNYAKGNVGHHMYGTSIKNDRCDQTHMKLTAKQGKPYCWHKKS